MYEQSCSTSDPKRSWSVKIYKIENVTVKKTFLGTDQTNKLIFFSEGVFQNCSIERMFFWQVQLRSRLPNFISNSVDDLKGLCRIQLRHSWILDSKPWDYGFFSIELWFRIPIVSGIPDSLSCISDSIAQDSRFQKQTFPRFWNTEFPYMGQDFVYHAISYLFKKITLGFTSIQFVKSWASFVIHDYV